jgi:hydroxymethylglutaryl-CoA lyase
VSSEDVVYLLHGLGVDTGIDLDRLVETGQWICEHLGIHPQTRAGNALAARKSECAQQHAL